MKRFLIIILTAILALSCFACANNNGEQGEGAGSKEQEAVCKPMYVCADTIIKDVDGIDKCFWEDGKVKFDDYGGCGRQKQKSAVLSVQTEYDLSYYMLDRILDFSCDYYPAEFEYDETKFEIKSNPDKENHFILKVLQPCENENVVLKTTDKSKWDGLLDDNGEPIRIPFTSYLTIIISSGESLMPV